MMSRGMVLTTLRQSLKKKQCIIQNEVILEGKEKYRRVFEIQRSGDKTSSGEIGLDIRTHASPKVGQDQVSGGVSVLCWHTTPVADILWKRLFDEMSVKG